MAKPAHNHLCDYRVSETLGVQKLWENFMFRHFLGLGLSQQCITANIYTCYKKC